MKNDTCQLLRIGAVNYLNSKPLIEGLAELVPEAELVLDFPSRLADRLTAGTLDVALVPSIACLLEPNTAVSDAASRPAGRPQREVVFPEPPRAVLAGWRLDVGSRTSATLARILLSERRGVHPGLEPLPLDRSTTGTDADAVC